MAVLKARSVRIKPQSTKIKRQQPLRKIIEGRTKKSIDKNVATVLRVSKKDLKYSELTGNKHAYYDVTLEPNEFKSKTDYGKIEQIKKTIHADAKNKFGNSTLIQIKNNLGDPRAPHIPNSLPRRSSVFGILNAIRQNGINRFAIAVTDAKTGKVMGYTVIGVSNAAIESHKNNYNYKTEAKFNSFIDNFIGKTDRPAIYYEAALKEAFGFNIKHLSMSGYELDPVTRDFRRKTVKDYATSLKSKLSKRKK